LSPPLLSKIKSKYISADTGFYPNKKSEKDNPPEIKPFRKAQKGETEAGFPALANAAEKEYNYFVCSVFTVF
jgi:hypothetical protein